MSADDDKSAPPNIRSRLRTIAKWAGLLACAILCLAWSVSQRQGIGFVSADCREEWTLLHGELTYGWRDSDWRRELDRDPPQPGWWKATWSGRAEPSTIAFWRARSMNGISVAIWILWTLCALPTALFWWMGRYETIAAWRRAGDRLRPTRRVRLEFPVYLACTAAHFAFFALVSFAVGWFGDFMRYELRPPNPPRAFVCAQWLTPIAMLVSPIAGLLWAFALVRVRNHLLSATSGHCVECGYSLTGNVSGRCPECGAASNGIRRCR